MAWATTLGEAGQSPGVPLKPQYQCMLCPSLHSLFLSVLTVDAAPPELWERTSSTGCPYTEAGLKSAPIPQGLWKWG